MCPSSSYSVPSAASAAGTSNRSVWPAISPVCCTTGWRKRIDPPRTKTGMESRVTGTTKAWPPSYRRPPRYSYQVPFGRYTSRSVMASRSTGATRMSWPKSSSSWRW